MPNPMLCWSLGIVGVLVIVFVLLAVCWNKPILQQAKRFLGLYKSQSNNDAVLVLGYAPWCPKCKGVLPIMQSLQNEHPGRVVLKNADAKADKKWFTQNKQNRIPVLGVMDLTGKLLAHHTQMDKSSIVAFAKQHGIW